MVDNALSSTHLRLEDAEGVDKQNMRLLIANDPRQEKTAFPPKGKGKSSPPKAPPPKANNNNNNKGGGKGNAGAKPKNQSKPKSKAAPKPKAEAGHIEIDWASQTHSDPFASSSVTIEEVAMHLAEGTFLQSDHTAFTFYTTFLPSFHSTSATDESGVLPPILDTGATHCLLPLSFPWLLLFPLRWILMGPEAL